MKILVDIILVDNIDKEEFINSLDASKVELWNIMKAIPNLLVLNIEKDYFQVLDDDERIITIEERKLIPVPASIPNIYTMTKNITATTPSTIYNGADYAPLQFYLDTDLIKLDQTAGIHSQDYNKLFGGTYYSRWTGKNVDIVTLEVGPVSASLNGVHSTHPDFENPDSPGPSRLTAMNWLDLEDTSNNQISTNNVLSAHAMGVLSAAGGTICGFAKKANLYAVYITAEDGPEECINAIIYWHNNKAVNPNTGVKNPTIFIAEYQYLFDRKTGIKINDIASIYDQGTLIQKPVEGWGTNFTPFTSRNIIPFKILDPMTSTWEWCIVFPWQAASLILKTAYDAAWDAGIVNINAAGNNGGVYVKQSDSRLTGIYCNKVSGSSILYNISGSDVTTVNPYFSSTTIWYPFYTYGPAGYDKAIDVAAGQNSETHPILDSYSNRGPGIDIVGLGSNTWTAYPATTYIDGNSWGMFSGTSCAAPTVVGKVACMMERYYTYNKVWPTPNQIKNILLGEAKNVVKGVDSTTWSNVPSASTNYSVNEFAFGTSSVNTIQDGVGSPNGSFTLADLAGTTSKRAFLNAKSFSRTYTYGKRPSTGKVYPRTKINNYI